jgi:hypothetical protein
VAVAVELITEPLEVVPQVVPVEVGLVLLQLRLVEQEHPVKVVQVVTGQLVTSVLAAVEALVRLEPQQHQLLAAMVGRELHLQLLDRQ